MVNLFILIFSLFIQFGTVAPFELVPDDNTLLLIQEIRNACLNSNDIGCLFFADTVQDFGYSDMPYYIELGSNGYDNYRVCFPTSYQNTSLNSSCLATWYMEDRGSIFCNIQWVNYTVFWYNSSSGFVSTSSNLNSSSAEVVVPFLEGQSRTRLIALNGDIRDSNGNILIYYESFISDTPSGNNFAPIGSLDITGHSSGGSPFETIKNSSISWGSVTGHSSGGSFSPSPHSSSSHYNVTTPSPDNTDSKTDSLLYMLGNKLADITENTSSISSILGGVMYNQVQGASAIFNGISALNDNFVSFASYLTAIPTVEEIDSALNECENIGSLRDLSESINIWDDIGLSQVESAPTYTFNFNGTMFEAMGNFTLNFNFLDSTKNIWQPLFIALLYFNLLITLLTGLPDLIQGRGDT